MGYYVSVLQKGVQYELEGRRLEFVEKTRNLYWFYLCKKDEWSLDYERTDEMVSYTFKELNFLKRINECSARGTLKPIGKDKVFKR